MALTSVKYASILLGAVAFTSLLPLVSLAKPQATEVPAATTHSSKPSLMEELKLTEQQKNSIRGIRAARTREIDKHLTEEQKTKLQTELKSGKKLGESLKTLNLNSNQKKEILAIVEKSNQEIKNVLTPTQKQQLAAYLRQHHQNQAQVPID